MKLFLFTLVVLVSFSAGDIQLEKYEDDGNAFYFQIIIENKGYIPCAYYSHHTPVAPYKHYYLQHWSFMSEGNRMALGINKPLNNKKYNLILNFFKYSQIDGFSMLKLYSIVAEIKRKRFVVVNKVVHESRLFPFLDVFYKDIQKIHSKLYPKSYRRFLQGIKQLAEVKRVYFGSRFRFLQLHELSSYELSPFAYNILLKHLKRRSNPQVDNENLDIIRRYKVNSLEDYMTVRALEDTSRLRIEQKVALIPSKVKDVLEMDKVILDMCIKKFNLSPFNDEVRNLKQMERLFRGADIVSELPNDSEDKIVMKLHLAKILEEIKLNSGVDPDLYTGTLEDDKEIVVFIAILYKKNGNKLPYLIRQLYYCSSLYCLYFKEERSPFFKFCLSFSNISYAYVRLEQKRAKQKLIGYNKKIKSKKEWRIPKFK